MSEDHPLAYKEKLSLSDFEPYVEITHGDCNVPYINVAQSENVSLAISGKKVVNLYKGTDPFLLLSMMPSSFMWVSPTPDGILKRYRLVQRSCNAPAHKYKDVMVCREGTKLSDIDRRFIDKLYETKNKVTFGIF
jgi:hypothetical protein